jgi:hypothetical protein
MRLIDQPYLRYLFNYDYVSGWFTFRVRTGQRSQIGLRAGSYDGQGYRQIQINGQKYKEHRLAWMYVFGYWPIEIDHRDGSRDFNAISNLREVTRSENVANSLREVGTSGLRGVKFDPKTSTWRSRVAFGYYREWLGPFDTKEEAYEAYLVAAENTHGEYALHNRPQQQRM